MPSGKQWAKAVACAGLFALGGCRQHGPASAPPPPLQKAAIVATCASAHGDVSARPAGATYWEPVNTGGVFRLADWVRTGELSSARVEFVSGGRLELEPKTIVVIDRLPAKMPGEAVSERVALQQGAVHGYLPEGAGSSAGSAPLRLRTADGSELLLSSEPGKKAEFRLEQRNGKTEVAVLSGAARIGTALGVRSLVAGQFAQLGAGGAPGLPEDLIDFPTSTSPAVDARFHGTKALSVELHWSDIHGATGYHVQVARDLSFQQLVVNDDVDTTTNRFRPGAVGMFAWRVASRDRDGRLGEYGFVRRLFVEIEDPVERLEAPAAGAVLKLRPEDKIAFHWQPTGDGHYRFVLSRTADLLAAPEIFRSADVPQFELTGIDPGDYHWGVYLERKDGTLEPVFLAPRRLSVRRAPKAKVSTPEAIRNWGE